MNIWIEPNPNYHWKCPVCGYIIFEEEHLLIKYDPKCPRCCTYKYSDFVRKKNV